MGNRIFKKTMAVILAVTLIIGAADFSIEAEAKENKNASWMSELNDELYLSQITIPGTHDSGTQHVDLGYVMKCQNTSIKKQLENGYRYIDLRLCIDEKEKNGEVIKKLKIVHNFANCHVSANPFSEVLTFEAVTKQIYEFLDENPTEAVIINCKIEDDEHSVFEIQSMMETEIDGNRQYWDTDDEIPQLSDIRGKIKLFTRFDDEAGYDDNGIILKWDEQNNVSPVDIPYELYVTKSCRLWVQDRYKYAVDNKYEAVVDGLENCEADENTFFFNFVSTSGSGKIGHPKGYAKQLNKLLLSYELQSETSYGIIIVDFGSKNLATHIYESNF